jgi:hypothetical protein
VPSKIASDSERKAFRAIDITTLHLTAGYIRDWEAVFEAVWLSILRAVAQWPLEMPFLN